MAETGLKHPVVARLTSHTPGSDPVYGTGMVAGHAIRADLTYTRNNNPLYADDVIVEDDNGTTGMTVEFELDKIVAAARELIQGVKAKITGSGNNAVTEYRVTDASAPYVGFGFYEMSRENGETLIKAHWVYKSIFGEPRRTRNTRRESIEWQTTTIQGHAMGVRVDDTEDTVFETWVEFETEAEAVAWLNSKANIT